ncbi:MAG TPA: lysophospholipid acyltransferase family protein [Candidatus Saccharimonadales bacterium]|nr:lysophospholipid acyltransferase family protein [Candidatus Saccharimonadales bacterium]
MTDERASGGMKPQKYKSQHPPEYYLPYQVWARENDPDAKYPVYRVIKFILVPLMRLLYRAEARGTENIPAEGMVILVPNHFSFFDHFVVGMFVPRKVRFMAKSQLFDKQPGRWIFQHGGVFPVARGVRDDHAFSTARIILESKSQPVVMYAQGGRDRSHEILEPAKPGVGKLARMTGAPVIPVAVYGASTCGTGAGSGYSPR